MRRLLVAASAALLILQLWSPPVAQAATNPPTEVCPPQTSGFSLHALDDDDTQELPVSFGTLWHRTPEGGTPSNPDSGASSWFGWDPDPARGDPRQSAVVYGPIRPWSDLNPYGTDLLIFRHAWDFQTRGGSGGQPVTYPDGGRIIVQTYEGVRGWVDRPDIPIENGPQQTQEGTGHKIFGGNSGGYQTSYLTFNRLLQESQVRILFVVSGDATSGGTGWWIDQVEFAGCSARVPGPTYASSPTQAGLSTMEVHWRAPTNVGSGIARYVVVATDGQGRVHTLVLPPSARSVVIHDLTPGPRTSHIRVAGTNAYGEHGDPASFSGFATGTSIAASAARVRPGKSVRITGRTLRAGFGIRGMPVLLQQRNAGTPWKTIATDHTLENGWRSWSVRVDRLTAYRVISQGRYAWRGSISRQLLVRTD